MKIEHFLDGCNEVNGMGIIGVYIFEGEKTFSGAITLLHVKREEDGNFRVKSPDPSYAELLVTRKTQKTAIRSAITWIRNHEKGFVPEKIVALNADETKEDQIAEY